VEGAITLVGLVDGLGHGTAAADAAGVFCDYVRAHADVQVTQLLLDASTAMRGTRGAVAALLRFDLAAATASFAGVGNIELRAWGRAPFRPVSMPGVLGRPVRKVVCFTHALSTGDLFVLHSDGVSTRFDLDGERYLDAQPLADLILGRYGKDHDDASCVVVRYAPVEVRSCPT
jgi:hypothetical protein